MNYSKLDSRKIKDIFAKRAMFFLCLCILSLTLFIAVGLWHKSAAIFSLVSLKSVIFSTAWRPFSGQFGLGGFIIGTFWVTAIAMLISIPLSVLTAIYLSEYAGRRLRNISEPIIDLLAGISPVVYGVWGVIAIVPLVRNWLMPFFSRRLPFFPFASDNFTGFSVLSAGIVLAVMTFPIIISISKEALKTVPLEIREASLALGATK
ncbi:MAG: ABC transporter permease subunit, partial [Candidatus Omnitrophica bacterium]|nr:ABC transporter permease subunit [Candidatus Omnitrophota bacterium]